MKWRGRRGSRNIEDRRSAGRGARRAGGVGGLGVVVLLLAGYFLGIDVTPFLNQSSGGAAPRGQISAQENDEAAAFVSVVLADTEEIWAEVLPEQTGRRYDPPTLVLFSGTTQSPCGGASGATGPFYCPADRKAYLDTAFFATLSRQFGAGGDFAAAYVVAHEVAHHIQNELGILGKANAVRARAAEAEANRISVMIELQADCFSGIWARYAAARLGTLEPGDIEEALNAAARIGDDTLQRAAGRRPMPDSFTHGTSDQRQRWFSRGYESADMARCDTFSAASL